MRISILLMLVVSVGCILAESTTKPTKEKPTTTNTKTKTKTKLSEPTKSSKSSASPGDNRGKRTLFHFGNPGYNYPQYSNYNRRATYPNSRSSPYYPFDAYQTGQDGQYPSYVPEPSNHLQEYGHYQYPQYVEAPEPIIEIIIKDSNETLPQQQPKAIVQKKKKEKVQVFYVKYKKDANNKLHLESPIASLNNDDNEEEEEEEEIIEYPAVVTPLPPLKTTTLRTIIHPESEKFHSNSGIHVSFGSEDKSQYGHQIQEHNAESIVRSIVALPEKSNYLQKQARPKNFYEPRFGPEVRSDTNSRSSPNSNLPFYKGIFKYSSPTNQNKDVNAHQQQLPVVNPAHIFRQPPQNYQNYNQQFATSSTGNNFNQQSQRPTYQTQYQQAPPNQYQQQNFQQQYQNRPSQTRPQQHPQQQQSHQQKPSNQQQQRPPQLHQHQQFNGPQPTQSQQQQQQQQQQQPPQHHHQHQPQPHIQHLSQQQIPPQSQPQSQFHPQKPEQPQKVRPLQTPVYFPAAPTSHQELPSKHDGPLFQNFRPTAPHRPIPIPIHPSEGQHQQKQEQQHAQQTFNRPPTFDAHQQQNFPNRYRPEQPYQPQNPQIQQHQQNKYFQSNQNLNNGERQNPNDHLGSIQNLFNISPSKGTELLKSIPKYEQHITETINVSPSYQTQAQSLYQEYAYSNRNNVIKDVPAPNLGPTTPSSIQTQQFDNSGQYLTAASNQQQQQQQFSNFVTSPNSILQPSSTAAPQYAETNDGQQIQIVTPMPSSQIYNYQHQDQQNQYTSNGVQPQIILNSQPRPTSQQQKYQPTGYSVSTLHTDAFQELEQRKQHFGNQPKQQQDYINIQSRNNNNNRYITSSATSQEPTTTTTTAAPSVEPAKKPSSGLKLQLPDEVPDDLRQQLISSGILDNADISVLDYDKEGDIAIENLPQEHLQHFYGAGGGAQISESNRVLSVVRPNGEKVSFSEKQIDRVKETSGLPNRQNVDLKVVRFDSTNQKSVTDKYLKSDSTVLPPVDIADRQYNRYLPLKVSGAHFPIPDAEELQGRKISSVVVLAPVDTLQGAANQSHLDNDGRQERDVIDSKHVQFIAGDTLKQLIKKPTKENFKKWLDKESKTAIDLQSVILLVSKNSANEQEIFMYDIANGSINKLNGELSSAFVNVAEENASAEDLENASIYESGVLKKISSTAEQF